MTIETKTTVAFNQTEKRTFDLAYQRIKEMKIVLDGKDLYNPYTGETIGANELPRVLGILDGLANCPTWIAN